MHNDELILKLKDISKSFPGTKALDKIHLNVYKGKVTTLMGENGAGKSTVMNIIFGIHKRNEGTILFKGKEVHFKNPKEAMENGISMVHQELNQYSEGTIIDNIWMGRYPKIGLFIDKIQMKKDTKNILKSLNIDIDPMKKIKDLSISEKQMIEIAKAISYNSKILVLDEPTSSLTTKEIKNLFSIIKNLKNLGIGILFVSHKMNEIFAISDYIAVFRDGKHISEGHVSEYTKNKIIKDMVGREINEQYPQKPKIKNTNDIALDIDSFSSKKESFKNIKLQIRKGEIFGIAGLVGSKRTEILESLFGLRQYDKNTKITFLGKNIKNSSPKKSIKNKFALVTEERKEDGLFHGLDVQFNINISRIQYYKGPFKIFLNKKLMAAEARFIVKRFDIKTPSIKTSINLLSGGNQQKVILSRWLLTKPKILLLDEPTRGIDVGAKYEIYKQINELSLKGTTSIVVSSEMQELIGICHRIAVISNGNLAGIVFGKDMNQNTIMKLATKYY